MIFMIAIQFYKRTSLKYPPDVWEIELATIFMFGFSQIMRLYQGMLGNKSESWDMVLMFQIASIGTGFMLIYFAFFQTYCVLIEILLTVVLIGLHAIEFIQSLLAICRFYDKESQTKH